MYFSLEAIAVHPNNTINKKDIFVKYQHGTTN